MIEQYQHLGEPELTKVQSKNTKLTVSVAGKFRFSVITG